MCISSSPFWQVFATMIGIALMHMSHIHVNLLPKKIWRNFLENWLKKLENFVGQRYTKNVGK